MTTIHPGRFTAVSEDEIVVFLIGMRANALHRPDFYVPVARSFMRMTKYLESHPETGFLSHELWLGRTTISVQYWTSTEALQAFASDSSAPHVGPWRKFIKTASNRRVGVWHETFAAAQGSRESIYVNMPTMGLGKAIGIQEVGRGLHTARQRLAQGR